MSELERLDFLQELIQRGRQASPFRGTLRHWQVDSDLAQTTWEWPRYEVRVALTDGSVLRLGLKPRR